MRRDGPSKYSTKTFVAVFYNGLCTVGVMIFLLFYVLCRSIVFDEVTHQDTIGLVVLIFDCETVTENVRKVSTVLKFMSMMRRRGHMISPF